MRTHNMGAAHRQIHVCVFLTQVCTPQHSHNHKTHTASHAPMHILIALTHVATMHTCVCKSPKTHAYTLTQGLTHKHILRHKDRHVKCTLVFKFKCTLSHHAPSASLSLTHTHTDTRVPTLTHGSTLRLSGSGSKQTEECGRLNS